MDRSNGAKQRGTQECAPVALGDLEQWEAESETWHPVSTRLSVERSYHCSLSLARDMSGEAAIQDLEDRVRDHLVSPGAGADAIIELLMERIKSS